MGVKMAFHRIGNSIYSDDELRGKNEEMISIIVPTAVTAIIVYYLYSTLSTLPFFVEHTTTAKLLYVFTGLTTFCISFTLRKLIVSLVVLGVMGAILALCGMGVWQWLMN